MSRTVLLQKIRHACRQSGNTTDTVEIAELPAELPGFPAYEDPVAQFREQLEQVDGVFLDGRGEARLAEALAAVLAPTGATEIFWEGEDIFEKHGLPHRLRNPQAFQQNHLVHSFHFRGQVKFPLVLHSKPYRRQTLASLALSVSSARYGIAETGTIVHQVGPGKGRLLSVLPPAHAVLLSEHDLLMNHAQFFEVLDWAETGSAVTMITGPSRTADIEKTLVIGVHGPQRWYVILTA